MTHLYIIGLAVLPLVVSPYFSNRWNQPKWPAYDILILIIAIVAIFRKKEKNSPLNALLSPPVTLALLGTLIVFGINFYTNRENLALIMERFFGAWILFFAVCKGPKLDGQFFKKLYTPLAITSFFVAVYGLVQVMGYQPIDFMKHGYTGSFFGNPTFCAEFLGFCFLVFFHRFEFGFKRFSSGLLNIALTGLMMATIYHLGSRTVVLALIIALGFGISLTPFKSIKKMHLWYLGFCFILAFGISVGVSSLKRDASQAMSIVDKFDAETKIDNASGLGSRIALFKASWNLFLDNPSGIGVNRYQYNVIPYQNETAFFAREKSLLNDPHNEYMRILTEWGIYGAPLAFLALLWGLLFVARSLKYQVVRGHLIWVTILLFYLIIAGAQFPLTKPFPSFLIPLVLGQILIAANRTLGDRIYWGGWVNGALIWAQKQLKPVMVPAILIGLILGGGAIGISNVVFSNHKSMDDLKFACKLNPGHFMICNYYAAQLYQTKNYKEAAKEAENRLRSSQNNYVAIYTLANIFNTYGDSVGKCFYLDRYRKLFPLSPNRGSKLFDSEGCP